MYKKRSRVLARLYEVKAFVKARLWDTPGARARDQNVQFLRLGQFISSYVTKRDRGFMLCIPLQLGKMNRNQLTISDVDPYFIVHCT